MSAAVIKACTCENKGQDRLHGKGRRVHNYCETSGHWRCTVCSAEKSSTKEDHKQ